MHPFLKKGCQYEKIFIVGNKFPLPTISIQPELISNLSDVSHINVRVHPVFADFLGATSFILWPSLHEIEQCRLGWVAL